MANKYHSFVSPRGTFRYPKLDQPYSFNTKLNKSMPDPEGQFEATLVLSNEDAFAFIKKIHEAIKDSGIDPSNLPYKKVADRDTGKPTGEVEFKFKAYGRDKNGSPQRIKFFDAKAKPIKGADFTLTSGSEGKIEGYISVAKLGARLNIRGVQVLALVERASAFTAEDDGFVYDGADEETAFAEDNSESGSDDSFDF